MLRWSQNLTEVYSQTLIAVYPLATVTEQSYWHKIKGLSRGLSSLAWDLIGGDLDHWQVYLPSIQDV